MTPTDLSKYTLSKGRHRYLNDGVCAMELVAHLAGEEHSDRPACTCPVIAAAMRKRNDLLPDDRRTAELMPLVEAVIGTRSTSEVERRRAFVAADYAVRVFAPLALDEAGLHAEADKLRALGPLAVDAADAAVDAATYATATASRYAAAARDAAAAAATAGTSGEQFAAMIHDMIAIH